MSAKQSLVICVVTDKTEHPFWFEPEVPKFDLFVVYCGTRKDALFQKKAKFYLESQGLFKLENIYLAVKHLGAHIHDYDAVWIPDDDIRATSSEINRFLEIFYKYNFDAAQPALKVDRGQINHRIFMQNPKLLYRRVLFLEMMAPIFKVELFLQKILATLKLNRSGFGLDFLWAQLLEGYFLAIIDATPVWHKYRQSQVLINQGVQGLYYDQLRSIGVDAMAEGLELVQKNKLNTVAYLNTILEEVPLNHE